MRNIYKYIATIIILLIFLNDIYGQVVALENMRENNLTIGIDNEIIVAVENVPCSEIEIKTTNGLVKATENKCHFILVPLNNSKTIIEIYRKTKDQLNILEKREFRTKKFQHPIFISINNRLNEITLEELNQADKVSIYAQGIDWDAESIFRLEKFKVEIQRSNNEQIMDYNNFSNSLSNEIEDAFKTLRPHDTIRIHDVYILTNNNYQMKIDDIIYSIIE